MESKRTQRKLNSWFWFILYTLPLLILLVLFIGYLSFYKTTGNEFVEKDVEFTTTTETFVKSDYQFGKMLYSSEPVYVENIYFDITLSVDEVISVLTPYIDEYLILQNICTMVPLFVDNSNNALAFIILDDLVVLSFIPNADLLNMDVLFTSNDDGSFGFVGWKPNFNGVFSANNYYINTFIEGIPFSEFMASLTPEDFSTGVVPDFSNLIVPSELMYSEFEESIVTETIIQDSYFTINYFGDRISLFDYSLIQSLHTFDGFVVPVLSEGLNSIFGYLNLDITSFIARFVVLLFTWMIQIKFIHIVVDLLSFVPDLYHDFTNGKRC